MYSYFNRIPTLMEKYISLWPLFIFWVVCHISASAFFPRNHKLLRDEWTFLICWFLCLFIIFSIISVLTFFAFDFIDPFVWFYSQLNWYMSFMSYICVLYIWSRCWFIVWPRDSIICSWSPREFCGWTGSEPRTPTTLSLQFMHGKQYCEFCLSHLIQRAAVSLQGFTVCTILSGCDWANPFPVDSYSDPVSSIDVLVLVC